MSYDRAITVFSPDGHLFQVEYAMEAVRRGSTAVGIKGKDCVVLAVERRALAKLQEARTIRKIISVDERSVLAFAGLTADARVLIQKIRVEAQSYRLTMEDSPSIDYLARYLARTQQQYTQRGGVRPFGIASLFCGVSSDDGAPELYQTDPAGTHSRWKAQVIGGRSAKSLREFLEKQYQDGMEETACVRLAVQALLEVVDSGAKTMEICVVRRGGKKEMMEEDAIETIVKEIESEQEEKRAPPGAASGGDPEYV
mmetsp:Transcript_25663/g.37926  ORF Transcript_25663/g.37926 Transcript_25663/m.37926 type:complete len:255 (-) Transcript_25663:3421-4185(-)|eukprot:CAMPEP_0194241078 /NCGR_PEP_ID=MMETSP0158-20130606/7056_1 /TAXON_ID=33649 /ORGANISM="Thalassionema nitzschioides, Strain L26-B" /LENGTH=254 /DNA_ID=CAMNT_0038975907 /DNA_START=69 /DNA_END=833 /DNA_ORIENTATION=+